MAFSSCNLDDGPAVHIDDSDEDEDVVGLGAVSSDDEALDEPRVGDIKIRSGVLDEKVAATQALGLFALHTKSAYGPYPFGYLYIKTVKIYLHLELFSLIILRYVEESLKIMVKHSMYVHEDLRLQAITGLKRK